MEKHLVRKQQISVSSTEFGSRSSCVSVCLILFLFCTDVSADPVHAILWRKWAEKDKVSCNSGPHPPMGEGSCPPFRDLHDVRGHLCGQGQQPCGRRRALRAEEMGRAHPEPELEMGPQELPLKKQTHLDQHLLKCYQERFQPFLAFSKSCSL